MRIVITCVTQPPGSVTRGGAVGPYWRACEACVVTLQPVSTLVPKPPWPLLQLYPHGPGGRVCKPFGATCVSDYMSKSVESRSSAKRPNPLCALCSFRAQTVDVRVPTFMCVPTFILAVHVYHAGGGPNYRTLYTFCSLATSNSILQTYERQKAFFLESVLAHYT